MKAIITIIVAAALAGPLQADEPPGVPVEAAAAARLCGLPAMAGSEMDYRGAIGEGRGPP